MATTSAGATKIDDYMYRDVDRTSGDRARFEIDAIRERNRGGNLEGVAGFNLTYNDTAITGDPWAPRPVNMRPRSPYRPSFEQSSFAIGSCYGKSYMSPRHYDTRTTTPALLSSRMPLSWAPSGAKGRSEVHAERSRATSQGCGQVADTRGLHKDAALASYSPNCTF